MAFHHGLLALLTLLLLTGAKVYFGRRSEAVVSNPCP